jgi:DNA-binding transcriptional ArsR family regulator
MDKEILSRIKSLLRQHPKGLTISEITSRLTMNRNSVSKYLGVLEVTGYVESCTFGSSRAFYLSRRIPASAFLSLNTDLVSILDNKNRILFLNAKFLDFFGIQETEIIGQDIGNLQNNIGIATSSWNFVPDILPGDEAVREVPVRKGDEEFYFRVRVIPTVFEDGSEGKTVLMEDATKERKYIQNLEFLTRASKDLANMREDTDIYQYIGEKIRELEPKSIVSVGSIDRDEKTLTGKCFLGEQKDLEEILEAVGRDPMGMKFSMESEPSAEENLSKNTLQEAPSLYRLFFRQIPEPVMSRIESDLSFGKGYVMGCVCRGGLFGNVAIQLKKGAELRHKETIEAFLNLAAVALQKRHIQNKLRKLEGWEKIHPILQVPRDLDDTLSLGG